MNFLLMILIVLIIGIFFMAYEYFVYRNIGRIMSRFAEENSLEFDEAEYKPFGWTSHHVTRGTYLDRKVVVSQSNSALDYISVPMWYSSVKVSANIRTNAKPHLQTERFGTFVTKKLKQAIQHLKDGLLSRALLRTMHERCWRVIEREN